MTLHKCTACTGEHLSCFHHNCNDADCDFKPYSSTTSPVFFPTNGKFVKAVAHCSEVKERMKKQRADKAAVRASEAKKPGAKAQKNVQSFQKGAAKNFKR